MSFLSNLFKGVTISNAIPSIVNAVLIKPFAWSVGAISGTAAKTAVAATLTPAMDTLLPEMLVNSVSASTGLNATEKQAVASLISGVSFQANETNYLAAVGSFVASSSLSATAKSTVNTILEVTSVFATLGGSAQTLATTPIVANSTAVTN